MDLKLQKSNCTKLNVSLKYLGDEAAVDRLIKSGTNLDPSDLENKTPLYLAVEKSKNYTEPKHFTKIE